MEDAQVIPEAPRRRRTTTRDGFQFFGDGGHRRFSAAELCLPFLLTDVASGPRHAELPFWAVAVEGALLPAAPADAHVCVYGTFTLYQFPPDALRATLKGLQTASRRRPVDFLSIEGSGDGCSEIKHTVYRDDERETTLAANCNPHGRWLEWLV